MMATIVSSFPYLTKEASARGKDDLHTLTVSFYVAIFASTILPLFFGCSIVTFYGTVATAVVFPVTSCVADALVNVGTMAVIEISGNVWLLLFIPLFEHNVQALHDVAVLEWVLHAWPHPAIAWPAAFRFAMTAHLECSWQCVMVIRYMLTTLEMTRRYGRV